MIFGLTNRIQSNYIHNSLIHRSRNYGSIVGKRRGKYCVEEIDQEHYDRIRKEREELIKETKRRRREILENNIKEELENPKFPVTQEMYSQYLKDFTESIRKRELSSNYTQEEDKMYWNNYWRKVFKVERVGDRIVYTKMSKTC